MDTGTAIFLSSLVFATIALYAITKDRWHWRLLPRTVAQVVVGLVGGLIAVLILTAIVGHFGYN
jgi:hypothetical protein